ncbi:MAG: carbonate dehydratase [bacterium]
MEKIEKRNITHHCIRPNPAGDWPQIDPSAFVDPSAQIIGHVHIGQNVYVAPQVVIRADEADAEGKVHPIVIESETNIQDGVTIHSMGGTSVHIGSRSSIAHGAVIHGPCVIGERCFLALRAVLYSATLEDYVWVGVGSIIMRANIPSHTMIPAGSVIRAGSDLNYFRIINIKEEEYIHNVLAAASALREGYQALLGDPDTKIVAD